MNPEERKEGRFLKAELLFNPSLLSNKCVLFGKEKRKRGRIGWNTRGNFSVKEREEEMMRERESYFHLLPYYE